MNHEKPSFTDLAGEMHVAIAQREAANQRQNLRRLATYLDNRGWDPGHLASRLDIPAALLESILAVGAAAVCTECVFEMHHHCDGVARHPNGASSRCECAECRV